MPEGYPHSVPNVSRLLSSRPSTFSARSPKDWATTTQQDIVCFKSHNSIFLATQDIIKADWIDRKRESCAQLILSWKATLLCCHLCVADTATPSVLNTVQWQCLPSWKWTVVLCGNSMMGSSNKADACLKFGLTPLGIVKGCHNFKTTAPHNCTSWRGRQNLRFFLILCLNSYHLSVGVIVHQCGVFFLMHSCNA